MQAGLERAAEDRSAFLDRACQDDDWLRWEVESLLGYDERAAQFIERSPDEVAAAMLAAEKRNQW